MGALVRAGLLGRVAIAGGFAVICALASPVSAQASIGAQIVDGGVVFTKGQTIATPAHLVLTFTDTGGVTHNRHAAGDPGYSSASDFDSHQSGVQTLSKPKSVTFNTAFHSDTLSINDSATTMGRIYTRTETGVDRGQLPVNTTAPTINIHGGSGDDRLTLPPGMTMGNGTLELGGGRDMLDLSGYHNRINFHMNSPAIPSLGLAIGDRLEDLVLGSGDDWVTVLPQSIAAVYGMDGNDNIEAVRSNDPVRVEGNAGHDVIAGGVGDDVLLGGDGDDYIRWRNGDGPNDTILGESGTDRVMVHCTDGNDSARLMHVNQQITATCQAGRAGSNAAREMEGAWVLLEGGNDRFEFAGNSGQIHVFGGAGNDTIGSDVWSTGYYDGEEGNDTLRGARRMQGGVGRDRLVGGNRPSELNGGDGNDVLEGGNASEELHDGNGRDVVLGGGGNDMLIANGVNDGADRYVGGRGTDTLDYRARRGGIQLSNRAGENSGSPGEGDVIAPDASIENFNLTNHNDTVRVSAARSIHARGGRDRIQVVGDSARVQINASQGPDGDVIRSRAERSFVETGSGDDDVRTGIGSDRITDIGGSNTFRTGDGNDSVSTLYNEDNDVTTALLGNGDDSYVAYRGASQVSGGNGDDRFTVGGDGQHDVSGDRGNDRLELLGTLTPDVPRGRARGGSGDDRITFLGVGGSGEHWSIRAGSGDDFINILSYSVERDVDCGDGNDSVLADTRDPELPATCERITRRDRR